MALIDEFNAITARPDQAALGTVCLKNSISFLHKVGYFIKDLVEVSEPINTTDTLIQLALPTNFRAWNYIRPKDRNGALLSPLESIQPGQLFEQWDRAVVKGLQRTGVYYNAGLNCNINLALPVSGLLLGYYALPDLTKTTYETDDWLVVQYKNLVLNYAAAYFYSIIENEAVAAQFRNLAMAEIRQLEIQETIQDISL